MTENDRKEHWEAIYNTKQLNEVSWYQPTPQTSLEFIDSLNLPKKAKIIDVGGGDSFLVDHLLQLEYENVTVLDISNNAIERAKQRLGSNADRVKWIVSDAATFQPSDSYDLWHDRAAFHFLTSASDIQHYQEALASGLKINGHLVIGTFADDGPAKCSGIDVYRYSGEALGERFNDGFKKLGCRSIAHTTPFNTVQQFTFCSFQKIA